MVRRAVDARASSPIDSHGARLMKFTPLNDRLLVKRTDSEEMSSGGIIIPDSAKEKPLQAEVVAVGTGKLLKDGSRRTPLVTVGDVLLFGKYSGDEVKLDGETHLILREDEVLAIIEN
jgi:chaperonin GroES